MQREKEEGREEGRERERERERERGREGNQTRQKGWTGWWGWKGEVGRKVARAFLKPLPNLESSGTGTCLPGNP